MATVSQRVKQVLAGSDKKQFDMASYFGISRQAMSNKIARDSWSAYDLAKVASFVGGELLIKMPDGQMIKIDDKESDAVLEESYGGKHIVQDGIHTIIEYVYKGYHIRMVGSDTDPFQAIANPKGWEIVENGMVFRYGQDAKQWVNTQKKNSDK